MEHRLSFDALAILLSCGAELTHIVKPLFGVRPTTLSVLPPGAKHAATSAFDPFALATPSTQRVSAASVHNAKLRRDIASKDIDAIVVCLYPELLPDAVLHLPPLGAVNIHPSLLPEHRGPSPVFWQMKTGADTAGVTIHHMEPTADTGAILTQERAVFTLGATLDEHYASLVPLMSRHLPIAIAKLQAGDRGSEQGLPKLSYARRPTIGDLGLHEAMDAEGLFRFVRGAARHYRLHGSTLDGAAFGGHGERRVEDAVGIHLTPSIWSGDKSCAIQCVDGVVELRMSKPPISSPM